MRRRFSLKAKQVAGVTSIVGLAVVLLSIVHLASLARVSLQESRSRGEMLAYAIYQRAREVVREQGDPYAALREDPGIRSILESSMAYSKSVTYAAIVDPTGTAIAHSFPELEGRRLPAEGDLEALLPQSAVSQLRAIYSARTLELRQPLLRGSEQFGSIRIGVSTLLIRADLQSALRPAGLTALLALAIATLVAMLLAQWMLRPIHVIKSGLTRLGRGEFGVTLDLPPGDEFGDLGSSFNTISAQLAASRARVAGQTANANFESVVERLEDAVAVFGPEGQLLFANSAMRETLLDAPVGRPLDAALPNTHPYRALIDQTLAERRSQGPVSAPVSSSTDRNTGSAERLMMTHVIETPDHGFMGVMLVARNLDYLGHVHSTLNYSRKLAALGRLLAGVAHEVKNPLNAMAIQLELLRQKLSGPVVSRKPTPAPVGVGIESGVAVGVTRREPAAALSEDASRTPDSGGSATAAPGVLKHVAIIGDEIRRLDQVVQGFLRFARPEEIKLQPVELSTLITDVMHVVEPEAESTGVTLQIDCPDDLPAINADQSMLRQALLNLAMNACQAMANRGGVLRFACKPVPGGRVEIAVEDTGVGIEPQHLEKIFDLYFTTKERGSGIGLSMVYRIVQLHDGEVEVQSTPGRGTTLRLVLPQA